MRAYWNFLKKRVDETPEEHLNGAGVVLVTALVVFCQHAWVRGFFFDGHLYAGVAKNAAEQGHWVVPKLSATDFPQYFEHPPLPLWIQGFVFKILGASWTLAHLCTALFSVGSVLLIFVLSGLNHARWWGYLAGMILALTPPFVKTTAYPNPDVPLTFFITLSLTCYFLAYSRKGFGWWLGSGIAFGLASLCKGPPALVVPAVILVHLASTSRLGELKRLGPWAGFLAGLLIFAIWPILLWYQGHLEGFQYWARRQILGTIVGGRGQEETQPFLYFVFLAKTAGPWLALALIGAWKVWRARPGQPLGMLYLIWLLVVLVLFSLLKFKDPRYLLPLYPGLAGLAACPLLQLSPAVRRWVAAVVKAVVTLAALLLLIFPLTVHTRRDTDLFKLADLLSYLPEQPTEWGVSEAAYGYWSFSAFASWQAGANTHRFSADAVPPTLSQEAGKKWLLLVTEEEARVVQERFPGRFRRFLRFPKKNSVVLLENSLWVEDGFLAPEKTYP